MPCFSKRRCQLTFVFFVYCEECNAEIIPKERDFIMKYEEVVNTHKKDIDVSHKVGTVYMRWIRSCRLSHPLRKTL